MAECRSCGAPILWGETKAGKKMPIDAESSPSGTVRYRSGVGGATLEFLTPLEAAAARLDGIKLHTSHFATCPHADEHRKPKRK